MRPDVKLNFVHSTDEKWILSKGRTAGTSAVFFLIEIKSYYKQLWKTPELFCFSGILLKVIEVYKSYSSLH